MIPTTPEEVVQQIQTGDIRIPPIGEPPLKVACPTAYHQGIPDLQPQLVQNKPQDIILSPEQNGRVRLSCPHLRSVRMADGKENHPCVGYGGNLGQQKLPEYLSRKVVLGQYIEKAYDCPVYSGLNKPASV